MDFETAGKGVNPFLMEDLTDYTSPTNASSNPFLTSTEYTIPQTSDNPFLSDVGASPFASDNSHSTNPFADFSSSYEPSANIFGNVDESGSQDYSNIFSSTTQNDFFGNHEAETIQPEVVVQPEAMKPEIVKPDVPPTLRLMDEDQNDFCSETSEIFGGKSEPPGPPRRPPPPRPVPPSKETKDLILSVTGAMEATSSHLLDRLQATRTPSPTPMRDINTPSPTLDQHYADLLDTGETRLPAFPSQVDLTLMNEPPSGGPAPPPRPQKPPEPQHDMFDMFGTSEAPKPIVPTSTADIISLFNQPQAKPIETQADLLGDDFGPEISSLQPDLMSRDFVPQEMAPAAVASTPVQAKDESFAAMGNEFETIPADTYPEVNDNIPHITASTVDVAETQETFQTFPGKKSSIPEIIKSQIPETFVSNIPDTFTSEMSDTFGTNMTDSYSPSTDPCDTGLQDNFGSMNPDGFETDQKETFSALSDTFTSTIPDSFGTSISDTFGSTVTSTYVSSNITDNIGTTVQDTFSSTTPSIFGTEQDTFGSNVDNTFGSVQDNTFGSVQDNTFGSVQDDTFGSVPDNTFGSVQDNTFGSVQDNTFGSVPDNTFGSVQDNTFGSVPDNTFGSVPDNTFGSVQDNTFGSNVDNTFGSVQGNTFGSNDVDNTFGSVQDTYGSNINNTFGSAIDAGFGSATQAPQHGGGRGDDFDAFSAKFDNIGDHVPQEVKVAEDPFDPFASAAATAPSDGSDAWGSSAAGGEVTGGFEADESFDAFLSMNEPPPPPVRTKRHGSGDSDEQRDFSVVIKPRMDGEAFMPTPVLAPPPKSPINNSVAFADNTSRFNPFDKSLEFAQPALPQGEPEGALARTDSQETPPTPLFDEDVSQPLEDFPRVHYDGEGWEMHLRQPNKKKITGQRFWKKVFVKLVHQGDSPVLQLYNTKDDKDPFQELPLQACYSVSDIGAQQYDNFGKIFTVKLQYVFYKERPGIRPGQVTKAERITNKLSQFAAYAIQGDYQGCKEFGSDLKKLGMPVEHAPQISQLFKLGCQSYDDLKTFSVQVEESLFRLAVHRDRALNYKTEEVQITAVDELHVEQDEYGRVEKQIARVRLFFLGFLAGMPDVELGVNDMWRQGKEVVGRHDIIPVVTEEWIRLENVEFHTCVQLDEYEKTHVIKFKPPDACYLELMRFRVRPPKNRELPLQVKTIMCVTGNKVELKCDILVPGFSSRKLGQVPCEDVMVRFPIPECWIYLFRVEKHFRYGSVKSTHRRTGKVKGIERFLGAVETFEQSLIEVTSGQAKYEHQHRAIVWRMARLPKEGQGAYTTHNLVCRMGLTSFDQIPDKLAEYCYVEFTMPATQVSHMTVRSVSLSNSAKDDPPEKYVRQLARHEYRVGIEHTQGEGPGAYIAATITKPAATAAPVVDQLDMPEPIAESDSDSSS